ncbi:MAG: serine hydrolase domain-containing protein [Acidobacteriota bacterium]|nr:MAG: serine hydrolase domain-containing protein [Acidobacteriota bacterium]
MLQRWVLAVGIVTVSCAPATQEEAAPVVVVDGGGALLESLESLVEDQMVAGAVGLAAKNGEVVFRGAAGYADRDSNQVMTPEHLFRIASMTKAVTSVAAMILVEEGRIALDDPASKFVPALAALDVLEVSDDGSSRKVPAKNDITVRHLLTHTSGLNYRFIVRGPLARYYVDADISDGLGRTEWDLGKQVEKLAALPLTHEPGTAWTYGLSTDVLGYLVELVSGQTLDVFLQERILTPLGMHDTHFFLDEEDWERLATVYRPDGAGGLDAIAGTVENGQTIFSVDAVTQGPRLYLSGGGGLVSSVDDYFRFCQMLLNGGELDGVRILKEETVELMTENQIGKLSIGFAEDKFGLGFSITQAAGDGIPEGVVGWGGFYGSEFWIDPENEIVAVFMSQVYDLPRRNEIVRRFGSEVFRALVTPTRTSSD